MNEFDSIKNHIENCLSDSEIEDICFIVRLDTSNLRHLTRAEKLEQLWKHIEQNHLQGLLHNDPHLLQSRANTLSPEAMKLIELHFSMCRSFTEPQIAQIVSSMEMKIKDGVVQAKVRDTVRELILWANRRRRLTELIDFCHILNPQFQPLKPLQIFDEIDFPNQDARELANAIASNLDLEDFKQLAFLLGVNYEDFDFNNFDNPELNPLNSASPKLRWSVNFTNYFARRGRLNQVYSAYQSLVHP